MEVYYTKLLSTPVVSTDLSTNMTEGIGYVSSHLPAINTTSTAAGRPVRGTTPLHLATQTTLLRPASSSSSQDAKHQDLLLRLPLLESRGQQDGSLPWKCKLALSTVVYIKYVANELLDEDRFTDIFNISLIIQRLCVQILHDRY